MLIDQLTPSVKLAWKKSVRDLAENVDFRSLLRAIENRDLRGAEEALNLDGSFDALEKSLLRAFEAGGKMTTKIISEEAAKVSRG